MTPRKRVREPWEKYGPRGRQVEEFVTLLDGVSQDQWVLVGKVQRSHNRDEYMQAHKEWSKVRLSATVDKALSSLCDRYRPGYDKSNVGLYTRGGIRDAKSVALFIVGIADRLPAWAVEVLLRSFVQAGVDFSSVLPEGMDVSHPIPHDEPSGGDESSADDESSEDDPS